MNKKYRIKREKFTFLWMLCIGVILRYIVMTFGHNFDFDSYCIVGEIAGNFRNVYAETTRYNYAPFFLCVLGGIYRISNLWNDWILVYRILIVLLLTMTDLGIAAFIAKRYSYTKALLFFLNPVSIIITGYHNQFDNIAVLFALLSTVYFNDDKKFSKKDAAFISLLSASLIVKHILFIFPIFILLMKGITTKKKIVYAIIPPAVFLLSFVPFAISSKEALQGIVNNVFMYRSTNNAPLLVIFYKLVDFPNRPRIIIFGIMMIAVAWIVRKQPFEQIMMVYLIAMVAFSSAISNQYLVIPMASLCILNVGYWNRAYVLTVLAFFILHRHEFGIIDIIQIHFPDSIMYYICFLFTKGGLILVSWILLFALIHLIRVFQKGEDLVLYGK